MYTTKSLIYFIIIFICPAVLGQFYEDKRCRCVCPSPASIINKTQDKIFDRKLYIAYVPPSKCNCDGVILPLMSDEIRDNAQVFCPWCECKYETRNTTIIMVVVIIVLWILMLLTAYLIFLMILDPLVTKRKTETYSSNADEAQNLLLQEHDPED
ncbi:proton-transporting V-type ATPase complex assembly regulator TMEM9-like isoform X2 [Leptidea sinapis]|uniref:Transmembrane protein 9 n=1 Tax=Leptidea sinapis TaxID=189913 RepID=A0A5E4PJY2_9NEOP|nr:proton-transporting V-type ATPase complex assembly regulator TMEM9-like isoform X2 [Leptidea sinapis]VVC86151.1 unnamed protein product [Leptidea sinapis]